MAETEYLFFSLSSKVTLLVAPYYSTSLFFAKETSSTEWFDDFLRQVQSTRSRCLLEKPKDWLFPLRKFSEIDFCKHQILKFYRCPVSIWWGIVLKSKKFEQNGVIFEAVSCILPPILQFVFIRLALRIKKVIKLAKKRWHEIKSASSPMTWVRPANGRSSLNSASKNFVDSRYRNLVANQVLVGQGFESF